MPITYIPVTLAIDPIGPVQEGGQFTVTGRATVGDQPEKINAVVTASVDLGLRADGQTSRGNALLGKTTTDANGWFGIAFDCPTGVLDAGEDSFAGASVQIDDIQFEGGDASHPIIDSGEKTVSFTIVPAQPSPAPVPVPLPTSDEREASRPRYDALYAAVHALEKDSTAFDKVLAAEVITLIDEWKAGAPTPSPLAPEN